jgi:hypothetical protein
MRTGNEIYACSLKDLTLPQDSSRPNSSILFPDSCFPKDSWL